jgi:hypothetical protein
MAKKYRKHTGRFEPWHFIPECPDWPEAEYIEQVDTPPKQELCDQCMKSPNTGSEQNPQSRT